jgi:hypothetical protein
MHLETTKKKTVKAVIEQLKAGETLFNLSSKVQAKLITSNVDADMAPIPNSDSPHGAEQDRHHDGGHHYSGVT